MPGCRRPAQCCDVDHARDFRRGKNGTTAHHNLDCLCERHHYLKDVPGWGFDLDEDTGELKITTPTGRTHATRPEPILRPFVGNSDESEEDDQDDSAKEEPPF